MADVAQEMPTLDGLKSKKFILTALAQTIAIAMQIMGAYSANQYVQIALIVCGAALQVLSLFGYYKANVMEKVGIANAVASVANAAVVAVNPTQPVKQ
jgi:hypothetical protein